MGVGGRDRLFDPFTGARGESLDAKGACDLHGGIGARNLMQGGPEFLGRDFFHPANGILIRRAAHRDTGGNRLGIQPDEEAIDRVVSQEVVGIDDVRDALANEASRPLKLVQSRDPLHQEVVGDGGLALQRFLDQGAQDRRVSVVVEAFRIELVKELGVIRRAVGSEG